MTSFCPVMPTSFKSLIMKSLLLSIIAFLTTSMIYADSPYVKEAEDAIIEVIYSRKQVTDTTMRDNRFFMDDVLLRIGNNKSLFCGVKKLWDDSISKVDYATYSTLLKASYEKDPKNFFFLGGTYWSYIYKDKTKKEVTECDYFDLTRWKYKEELQTPTWTITDSIKNCLGYECVMATTFFKGRNWIAWFSPEIPIPDGPWKLNGLPGLILEAYDVAHDYEYIPKAIHTAGLAPVGYMWYYNDYTYVSRDQFFKNWRKAKMQDGVAKIKAAYDIKSSSPAQKKTLSYDREEIDYPHE